MPHFFISSKNIEGKKVLITGPLVRHLKGSLRMRIGEKIRLVDEKMRGYYVVLKEFGRKEITGEVIEMDEGKPDGLAVTLAQGIIKRKKMDLVIQKATELGVKEIIPIISERCAVKPALTDDSHNLIRWQTIAVEASQQSNRWDIPSILPPTSLSDYLESISQFDLAIILWEKEERRSIKEILKKGGRKIVLLIGPEGGFTSDEIRKAEERGFIPVSLGQGTLRSETAAIAAISIIQYEMGGLGGL